MLRPATGLALGVMACVHGRRVRRVSTESLQATQARKHASSEAGPLGRRLRIVGATRHGALLEAPSPRPFGDPPARACAAACVRA